MKEIKDILNAYAEAKKDGKKSALATVVHVEGSSYRRPGARMLVTDTGELTGAISGGCLEGDALRKALLAISQQQNKLVTYDTTDDDDAKFGVQLGCNGIVHILFEPLREDIELNAMDLLQKLNSERSEAILITIFSLNQSKQYGTSLLYRNDLLVTNLDDPLKKKFITDAQQTLTQKTSFLKDITHNDEQLNAFVEYVAPPVSIVIAGAGNDVIPLVDISALLGWNITVVDGRQTHATRQRFPKAQKVLVAKPAEVLPQIDVDNQTVFLLMTHNYNYDIALLKELLATGCIYIGILGPKKKLEKMLDELREGGLTLTQDHLHRIYSPVGLDIDAETAEEIAISIVAEIKSVLGGSPGGSLKYKQHPIHRSNIAINE